MTRILLIRHGETDWNLKRLYQGHSDIALNETGLAQGARLRARIAGEMIDNVYSSDLKRAYEFARMAFGPRHVEARRGLREMHFGELEGLTYEEIGARYPGFYAAWLSDPSQAVIPGGESVAKFKKRVLETFFDILAINEGKAAAIVTHAGPIRTIMQKLFNAVNFWETPANSGSINIIDLDKGTAHLVISNDTAYLKDG
jgi:broad specificity phosphatase PhoE